MRYYPALLRYRQQARQVSHRWRVLAAVVLAACVLVPLWLDW